MHTSASTHTHTHATRIRTHARAHTRWIRKSLGQSCSTGGHVNVTINIECYRATIALIKVKHHSLHDSTLPIANWCHVEVRVNLRCVFVHGSPDLVMASDLTVRNFIKHKRGIISYASLFGLTQIIILLRANVYKCCRF